MFQVFLCFCLVGISQWSNVSLSIIYYSAIAVSIPYGVVADRVGRKKVLLMAMIGCLLSDIWVGVVSMFTS